MSIIQVIRRLAARPRGRAALAALLVLGAATLSVAAAGARSLLAPPQGPAEVRTTLGQWDFTPAEVTRGGGPFRLVVKNESGQQGLTFRLLRVDTGERLHESQSPQGAAEWSQEFDLPAGMYVLTEARNPAWLFYVTVQ